MSAAKANRGYHVRWSYACSTHSYVPHVGSDAVKSIVFVGNCQADAVRAAYQRFVSPRTGDRVRYVKNYSESPGEDREAIANADVAVQLVMNSESASGLEHAETRAKKYHIPFVTAGWLWPNHGTPILDGATFASTSLRWWIARMRI